MRVAKVFPPKKVTSGKLLGFTDIVFSLVDDGDGCMTIRGWKIFKGNNGAIQVGLPSRKDGNEYFPLISMDFDKPEAKAFMDHVSEEVAKVYNATASDETTSGKKKAEIEQDDIPF